MGRPVRSKQQGKPKNKILNRTFAIFFVFLSLSFFYYLAYGVGSILSNPVQLFQQPLLVTIVFFITIGVGFSIIFFGLLKEIQNPTLDFTFHRDWKWIATSIILFAVVILSNSYWWFAYGPSWLSQYGWQTSFLEFFTGNFTQDTTIISLMLGILF